MTIMDDVIARTKYLGEGRFVQLDRCGRELFCFRLKDLKNLILSKKKIIEKKSN